MNLRIYTLAVSVVATIGLLLSVELALRSALEYRTVDMPAELASADTFFVAKGKSHSEQAEWTLQRRFPDMPAPISWQQESDRRWRAMYDDAKGQYIQTSRSKALRGLLTYGTLCLLCAGLLVVHLRWARRLSKTD